MNSPPPQHQSPQHQSPQHQSPQHQPQPAAEPTAVAVASAVAADAARIFDEEVRSAVSYERGLAVKALLALGLVGLGGAGRVFSLEDPVRPPPRGACPPAIPRWNPP